MTNIIPFNRKNKANTEPVIWSDYWGENIPVNSLLEILEQVKENNKNVNKENE